MLLQIFLVEKIHLVELLLGSYTAVYNVLSKMPIFIWEVSVTQLELAFVSAQAVGICSGQKKFQKLFQEISVSSCLLSAGGYYLPAEGDGGSRSALDSLCKPNRARCALGKGGPSTASTRVPCLMYHLVQQFIAFQCCCMLRATALILHC